MPAALVEQQRIDIRTCTMIGHASGHGQGAASAQQQHRGRNRSDDAWAFDAPQLLLETEDAPPRSRGTPDLCLVLTLDQFLGAG